jgi:fructokinase
MNIATIGEALIDFKERGDLSFQGYVGGCHLNVAVAAARLGAAAAFAGQVSSDFFGDEIRAHMRSNGVDDTYVLTDPAPTTLAFVSERGGDAHFQFFRENAADRRYDPQPRPRLPAELAFLMFGSISLLQEPARTSILDVVAAHRKRCATVLDPNVRPLVQPDREHYAAAVESWIPLAGLVKVSSQDLGWLYPSASAGEVASGWLERGPVAVIVTSGSAGIDLYRGGHDPLAIRPPRVDTVDTVGAGDTFTGALMATLVEAGVEGSAEDGLGRMGDDAWRRALSRAAAAAALNCTRAGASPPRTDELARFISDRLA